MSQTTYFNNQSRVPRRRNPRKRIRGQMRVYISEPLLAKGNFCCTSTGDLIKQTPIISLNLPNKSDIKSAIAVQFSESVGEYYSPMQISTESLTKDEQVLRATGNDIAKHAKAANGAPLNFLELIGMECALTEMVQNRSRVELEQDEQDLLHQNKALARFLAKDGLAAVKAPELAQTEHWINTTLGIDETAERESEDGLSLIQLQKDSLPEITFTAIDSAAGPHALATTTELRRLPIQLENAQSRGDTEAVSSIVSTALQRLVCNERRLSLIQKYRDDRAALQEYQAQIFHFGRFVSNALRLQLQTLRENLVTVQFILDHQGKNKAPIDIVNLESSKQIFAKETLDSFRPLGRQINPEKFPSVVVAKVSVDDVSKQAIAEFNEVCEDAAVTVLLMVERPSDVLPNDFSVYSGLKKIADELVEEGRPPRQIHAFSNESLHPHREVIPDCVLASAEVFRCCGSGESEVLYGYEVEPLAGVDEADYDPGKTPSCCNVLTPLPSLDSNYSTAFHGGVTSLCGQPLGEATLLGDLKRLLHVWTQEKLSKNPKLDPTIACQQLTRESNERFCRGPRPRAVSIKIEPQLDDAQALGDALESSVFQFSVAIQLTAEATAHVFNINVDRVLTTETN